jgi:hypothetical protein
MRGVLLFCLILSGCCGKSSNVCPFAQKHAEKLRKHFKGERTEDVSTLISETKAVSARLRQSCMKEQANKFDSYVDVLTYGNRTIDESLNDVMELVKHDDNVCSYFQNAESKICSLF